MCFLCLNASKIFSFLLQFKRLQTLAWFILFSVILYLEHGKSFQFQTGFFFFFFQLKNISFDYM